MSKFTLFYAVFVLLVSANIAAADQGAVFAPVSVRASGGYIGSADYNDSDASSSVFTGQIRLNAGRFSMSYEGKSYPWDNVAQLSFGNGQDDPWDSLHRLTVGYTQNGAIDQSWFYGAAVTGTSAFEEEMSDSFGGALRGHIGYVFNDEWKALLGGRAFINSVRFSAMPYIGILYESYDENGAGFFMNLGAPATEAGYAFSYNSKIRFNFGIDGKTYRLADDSTVAEKGYVEISSMKAGVYYDSQPLKGLSLSVGPEYYFSRSVKTFDEHGDRFGGERDQDSALGGFLSLRYKF